MYFIENSTKNSNKKDIYCDGHKVATLANYMGEWVLWKLKKDIAAGEEAVAYILSKLNYLNKKEK